MIALKELKSCQSIFSSLLVQFNKKKEKKRNRSSSNSIVNLKKIYRTNNLKTRHIENVVRVWGKKKKLKVVHDWNRPQTTPKNQANSCVSTALLTEHFLIEYLHMKNKLTNQKKTNLISSLVNIYFPSSLFVTQVVERVGEISWHKSLTDYFDIEANEKFVAAF